MNRPFPAAILVLLSSICAFSQPPTTHVSIRVSPVTRSIREFEKEVTFLVERTAAASNPISVDYSTLDGTATAGLDYAPTKGTLIIEPWLRQVAFTVAIFDDGLTESDESFAVTVGQSIAGSLRPPERSSVITIQDDEGAGSVEHSFPIFGKGGTVITHLAFQPDGGLIALEAGEGQGLLRFKRDDSRDFDFQPWAPFPTSMVVQPDGRIIVAGRMGRFIGYGDLPPYGVARLNADGSLDTTFDAGLAIDPPSFPGSESGWPSTFPDSSVAALQLQPDGKVLVAGAFTHVGGLARRALTRLNPDGLVDDTFHPDIKGPWADSLALQADGKILIAGSFEPRTDLPGANLARVHPDGSPDLGFQTVVHTYPARILAVQPNGQVILHTPADRWTGLGRVIRVNPDGTTDPNFGAAVNSADDGGFPVVFAAVLQEDGRILIAGRFETVNGADRAGLARLNGDGTLDATFAPVTREYFGGVDLRSVLVQADGQVLVGGRPALRRVNGGNRILQFSALQYSVSERARQALVTVERLGGKDISARVAYSTIDGLAKAGMDYSSQSGTVDFAPSETSKAIAIPILNNHFIENDDRSFKVVLTNVSTGSLLGGLAQADVRILDDERPGGLDPDYDYQPFELPPEFGDHIIGLINPRPDGTQIVLTSSRWNHFDQWLIRVDTGGSINLKIRVSGADIRSIVAQADGGIVLGGFFEEINGTRRHHLARFRPDGDLDLSYDPGATVNIGYGVGSLHPQPDGRILVAGWASPESPGVILARLLPDGSPDREFQPELGPLGPGGTGVQGLWLEEDGRILVIGNFATVHGVAYSGIVRLRADGSLDSTFRPAPDLLGVESLAIQPDHKLVIAGKFKSSDPGRSRPMARLNDDGSLDPTFRVALSGPNEVYVRVVWALRNGKLLIVGSFKAVDGVPRDGVARLNADGSLDADFMAPPGLLSFLGVEPDGGILAEYGQVVNGSYQYRRVRLNSDTSYLQLLPPRLTSGRALRLELVTQPGLTYVLESSTDLIRWSAFETNTAGGFRLPFQDTAPDAARFYRAIQAR
jgi:uncharacterized delta-60 repeat protein